MNRIPITGYTHLIGLIADPIRHSLSPTMHNAAFDKLGLDYVYLVFEVGQEGLKETVNGLKAMHVRGFNVSMPNKSEIIEYLDEISPASRLCESVNTVINNDGKMYGTVTDGTGWVRAMKENDCDIKGKHVVLLGCGGAATAILVQGALDGVKTFSVFNRKDDFWDRGRRKCEQVREDTACKATLYDLEDHEKLHEILQEADILVNATSVGMKPMDDLCLCEAEDLRSELVVFDAVYNPKETKLLKIAKDRGCKCISGLYMMLYQGAEAFKLWTGEDMPIDYVMEELGL